MGKLNAKARNALPSSDFADPQARKFPIEDAAHARDALSRAAELGPTVEAHVAAAVKKHFPGIKVTDTHG